jgi:hypothetical protein
MINTVNILGIPYTVKRVPVVDKDEYSFGSIDFGDQEILIDDGLSEERSAITLLHEVIHGILSELKFHAENHNDTLVNGLAVSLYQCLTDNPLIFNITKPKKEIRMAKAKKNTKQTSPEVASLASKKLRDGRSSKDTKTLAATAVSQAGGKSTKKKR